MPALNLIQTTGTLNSRNLTKKSESGGYKSFATQAMQTQGNFDIYPTGAGSKSCTISVFKTFELITRQVPG